MTAWHCESLPPLEESARSEPRRRSELLGRAKSDGNRFERTNFKLDRRLSIAPMMDRTDRHFRYFVRLLSRRTLLYTEMLTTSALIHGDRARLLSFDPWEKPLALQVGGSDPDDLSICARIAELAGFDEINLNIGCPSERVQSGRFGACLMAEPQLVGDCVAAAMSKTRLPVTVKSRIGIDDRDGYEDLLRFVTTVAQSGCKTFIIHARKAWLKGLSPRENRELPPLQYDMVARLKAELPELEIVLNGGITSLDDARLHLKRFNGVMIGRAAYQNPYLFAEADQRIFGDPRPVMSRHACIEAFLPYVATELSRGTSFHSTVRHMLGLFHGHAGGRRWRRYLSEHACKPFAGARTLIEAAEQCARGSE